MNENLQNELAKLASKLGTSVDHLWSVLIRQAPIYSTVSVLLLVASLVLSIWSIRGCVRNIKDEPTVKVFSLLAIASTLCAIIILFDLPDVIAGFCNPEYWALQDVSDMFKK